MPVAGGWSRDKRYASLCRSWVFIASIAGVVIVIGVHGMVGFAVDLCVSWCLASASQARPPRAGSAGLEEPRDHGGDRH